MRDQSRYLAGPAEAAGSIAPWSGGGKESSSAITISCGTESATSGPVHGSAPSMLVSTPPPSAAADVASAQSAGRLLDEDGHERAAND